MGFFQCQRLKNTGLRCWSHSTQHNVDAPLTKSDPQGYVCFVVNAESGSSYITVFDSVGMSQCLVDTVCNDL